MDEYQVRLLASQAIAGHGHDLCGGSRCEGSRCECRSGVSIQHRITASRLPEPHEKYLASCNTSHSATPERQSLVLTPHTAAYRRHRMLAGVCVGTVVLVVGILCAVDVLTIHPTESDGNLETVEMRAVGANQVEVTPPRVRTVFALTSCLQVKLQAEPQLRSVIMVHPLLLDELECCVKRKGSATGICLQWPPCAQDCANRFCR